MSPSEPGLPYRAMTRVASAAMAVAGWAYLAIAGLICFDVLARRLLGLSSGSTTELSGYLMAGAMTWGMAATLLERGHVRVDVLVQRMPLGVRVWLHLLSLLLLLVVLGFFAWGAGTLALDSWQLQATDLSALRVPLSLPQGMWAAGMALFFIAVLALAARALRLTLSQQQANVDDMLMARSYVDEAAETLDALAVPEARR